MSAELTTKSASSNPFERISAQKHISAGAVAIEQERAIAEAQGKLVIAKRFPRDQAEAYQRVMESCSRIGMAEEALYSYPRGGQTVSGPSIRLAEELARCWGNIDYGLRELSRREGESEMDAYAWDLETNTISSQKFTVKHIRDKKDGGKALTDERDIYEIGANMGARRMRARILAVIPGDLADAAVAKCKETLRGNTEKPMIDRIRDVVAAFEKLGIKAKHIEKRFDKRMSDMLPDDLVELRSIYKSMRDGMTKAADWFGDTREVGAAAKAITASVVHSNGDYPPPREEQLGNNVPEMPDTGDVPVYTDEF